MGFVSQYIRAQKNTVEQAVGRGQTLWREVFGTDKERGKFTGSPQVRPGGAWGRSIVNPASTKRLIQALRSMAPGGWSDDRYEETKHFTGIPYVAIDRVSKQLAQAEFQVFEKIGPTKDDKRPVLPDTPAHNGHFVQPYRLVELLEKPNNQDSWGKWMYRVSQQMRLTGMALTWMVPSKLPSAHPDPKFHGCGTPAELYCIPTATAIPQPAINPDYPDGYWRIQPVYPYGPFSSYPTPASAVGAAVPAQWMLRFMYPHPLLRYDGYSPLTAMRLHIDEVESMDRSRWYKMKRSTNPSAVLNMKELEGYQALPDEEIERIHAEWEEDHEGPENAGKLIVCPPGGELAEWGQSPKEMDWANGWDQLTSFILGGGFGISKEAAGMLSDSAYATLFATMKQLHVLTLQPDCNDIANDLTTHLAPFFGNNLIVEIKCQRIDDHEILFSKIDKAMSAKAITKNQVLKMLDIEPTKEEWGNDIAGDPSPMEKEQQEQAQQQASMGGMEPGQEQKPEEQGEQIISQPANENGSVEDRGIVPPSVDRPPTPGKLNQGSLGPRKELLYAMRHKSLYGKLRKALANGTT